MTTFKYYLKVIVISPQLKLLTDDALNLVDIWYLSPHICKSEREQFIDYWLNIPLSSTKINTLTKEKFYNICNNAHANNLFATFDIREHTSFVFNSLSNAD